MKQHSRKSAVISANDGCSWIFQHAPCWITSGYEWSLRASPLRFSRSCEPQKFSGSAWKISKLCFHTWCFQKNKHIKIIQYRPLKKSMNSPWFRISSFGFFAPIVWGGWSSVAQHENRAYILHLLLVLSEPRVVGLSREYGYPSSKLVPPNQGIEIPLK